MTPTIVVDDELIRQLLSAEPPIDLIDPQGRFVGRIERFDDEAEEIRRRLNSSLSNESGD
jgi:hypothetical protein